MHAQEREILRRGGKMINRRAGSYTRAEKALVSRLAGSKIEYAKALFRKDAIQNVVQKHSSGGILLKSRIVSYDLIRKDLILGRAVRERNRGVAVKEDV